MTKADYDYGYPTYRPSILFVGGDNSSSRELRQQLEEQGCQVHQTTLNPAGLATARHNYFEIIVLALDESPDKDAGEACKLIETDPELASSPMVILTGCNPAKESMSWLKGKRPVYYLSTKDLSVVARLWQIIDERHYMIDRYM